MNETVENMLELPTPHKVGVLVGSVLAVFGLYWFAFHSGMSEKLTKFEKKNEDLRVEIKQKELIVRDFDTFLAEVKRLDIELNKALAELPDEKEINVLLSRISDKARDSGLEIVLFKQQQQQSKEFYAEVPAEIEVAGTYHQVATFFDEVGHLERIVNLDSFHMSKPNVEEGEARISTSVVATAFRFLDESERTDSDEDDGKKKKSKRSRKRRK